ncbi:MAG: TetR/AcrR family transcriptional regulator [Myxococcales bacterium]|nr:TetR/AcrR family transcriptional regulator [Myxococcales bacterium]
MTQDNLATVGRRERRKQQTRRALLDAAMELFAERGVYATRLEDITERADLGKGAFYNYFESKDALIAELISEGVQRLSVNLQGLDPEKPFNDRVGFVITAHERFFDEHPEQIVLFHQARGLLKLKTQGTSRLRQAFANYLVVIAGALWGDEGVTAESHPRRLDIVTALVGAITGYRSFRIAVGAPVNPDTIVGVLTAGLPDDETVRSRGATRPSVKAQG